MEKKEKGTTIWSRVSSFVTGTSTRVRNLTVGRQYEFRVMAENTYGTSDPCTMEPVYAQLPYSEFELFFKTEFPYAKFIIDIGIDN